LRATSGEVFVNGVDVTALGAPQRAWLGLGRAFQLTNLFPALGVLENVRLETQAAANAHCELVRPSTLRTLYGAVLSAALFVVAQNYLRALLGALSAGAADAGLPLLAGLFHPDRWLLWFGLLFALAVYFAPAGLVGALRSNDEAAP
jgi:ABC-type lipopolysaccharide export system ATPase subunit